MDTRLRSLEGRTVTFLFTDIESSTRHQARLREQYSEVRAEHHRMVRETFRDHGGIEVDTQGDSFFYVFPRARNAISAAEIAQRALANHPWPDDVPFRIRMGVHSGEPQIGEHGLVGLSVVRAARIMAAAHGGQVLVSQATCSIVRDDLPPETSLRDIGEYRLKDFDDPQRLYQLVAPGLGERFAPVQAARVSRRPQIVLAAAVAALLGAIVLTGVIVTRGDEVSTIVPPNALGVLDAGTNRLRATTALSGPPAGVALVRDAGWVTIPALASITRVNPLGDVMQVVPLGRTAEAHPTIAAADGDVLWVGLGIEQQLQRIDTRYVQPAGRPVKLDAMPVALALGGGRLWVATGVWVEQRDPISGVKLGPQVVPNFGATALALGAGRLWVGGAFGVTAIDPQGERPAAMTRLDAYATSIDVGAGGVWVGFGPGPASGPGSPTGVARIDPRTMNIRATVDLDARPVAVAVLGDSVWVATARGSLVRIDPVTNTIVRRIDIGSSPTALAAASGRLWVAAQ